VEVAHRHLEHERLNDGSSSFVRMPTGAHPSSKLAGIPISDDETARRWAPGFRSGPPVPTRSYDSSNVGHCMGERDEETSDVLGTPGNNAGNNDGKGLRPGAS
jgi:hypothetical protein